MGASNQHVACTTCLSVGPHPHVVAGRAVAAHGEREASPRPGAGRHRAPDGLGTAPHDLGVVAARAAAAAARVGGPVVERALPDPGAHHGRGAPPGAAAPAEQVLPVGPVRVRQRAVAGTRRRVPARVRRQALVPPQRGHAHRAPRRVVRLQEARSQARRLGVRGRGRAGQHDDGELEERRGGDRARQGEATTRHFGS